MESFKTILVAIDFSENSDHAFNLAVTIATAFNSRLVVLHVIDNLTFYEGGLYMSYPSIYPYSSIDTVQLGKELEEGAKAMMTKFCETRLEDFPCYASSIETGTPFSEIIRTADETAAAMIVLGTHGRSGFGRLVFGSTAERVVRGAHCPVLTVPLPSSG